MTLTVSTPATEQAPFDEKKHDAMVSRAQDLLMQASTQIFELRARIGEPEVVAQIGEHMAKKRVVYVLFDDEKDSIRVVPVQADIFPKGSVVQAVADHCPDGKIPCVVFIPDGEGLYSVRLHATLLPPAKDA